MEKREWLDDAHDMFDRLILRSPRSGRLEGWAATTQKPRRGVFPCAHGWTSLATLEQFAIAAECTAGARSLVPRHLAAAPHENRKGDPHPWLESIST
jgi:hypothetical protein